MSGQDIRVREWYAGDSVGTLSMEQILESDNEELQNKYFKHLDELNSRIELGYDNDDDSDDYDLDDDEWD